MNTVFINENKGFKKGEWRRIFQGEHKGDCIQFLIDRAFFHCINHTDIQCTAQIFLPDNKFKHKCMDIEEKLHDNKYRMVLPITKTITKDAGTIKIIFIFFDYNIKQIMKTDMFEFEIYPSSQIDSITDDFDESIEFDVIAEFQHRINKLEKSKADSIAYNADTNTLQLYANGKAIGAPIEIGDNDVNWEDWD